ncbi:hypothetical protein QTP70_028267, partial [Hemibagrus guttatus]
MSTAEQKSRATSTAEQKNRATYTAEQKSRVTTFTEQKSRAMTSAPLVQKKTPEGTTRARNQAASPQEQEKCFQNPYTIPVDSDVASAWLDKTGHSLPNPLTRSQVMLTTDLCLVASICKRTSKLIGIFDHHYLFDCKQVCEPNWRGQSRLYFLRRLASFNICKKLLHMLYQTVVVSALFYVAVCWGGSIKKKDSSCLDKLMRKTGSIVGTELDSLPSVAEKR